MDIIKAIEVLKASEVVSCTTLSQRIEARMMACEALEKQMPLRPNENMETWSCGRCGNFLFWFEDKSIKYCKNCGQRLYL